MIQPIANTRIIKPGKAGTLKTIQLSPFNSFALGKDYFPRLQKLFQDKYGITVKDAFVDHRAKIGIIAMDPSFIDRLEKDGDFSGDAFSDFTILLEELDKENEVNVYFLRSPQAVQAASSLPTQDKIVVVPDNLPNIEYCTKLLDLAGPKAPTWQINDILNQIINAHDQPDDNMAVKKEKVDLFEKIVSICCARDYLDNLSSYFDRANSFWFRKKILEGFYLYFSAYHKNVATNALTALRAFYQGMKSGNRFFKVGERFLLEKRSQLTQDIESLCAIIARNAPWNKAQAQACLVLILSETALLLDACSKEQLSFSLEETIQKDYIYFVLTLSSKLEDLLKDYSSIISLDKTLVLLNSIDSFCARMKSIFNSKDSSLESLLGSILRQSSLIRSRINAS